MQEKVVIAKEARLKQSVSKKCSSLHTDRRARTWFAMTVIYCLLQTETENRELELRTENYFFFFSEYKSFRRSFIFLTLPKL